MERVEFDDTNKPLEAVFFRVRSLTRSYFHTLSRIYILTFSLAFLAFEKIQTFPTSQKE